MAQKCHKKLTFINENTLATNKFQSFTRPICHKITLDLNCLKIIFFLITKLEYIVQSNYKRKRSFCRTREQLKLKLIQPILPAQQLYMLFTACVTGRKIYHSPTLALCRTGKVAADVQLFRNHVFYDSAAAVMDACLDTALGHPGFLLDIVTLSWCAAAWLWLYSFSYSRSVRCIAPSS